MCVCAFALLEFFEPVPTLRLHHSHHSITRSLAHSPAARMIYDFNFCHKKIWCSHNFMLATCLHCALLQAASSTAALICCITPSARRHSMVAVSTHCPKNNSHRSLCWCPSKRSLALHELFVNSMAGGLDVNEAGKPVPMIGQSAWITHSTVAFN